MSGPSYGGAPDRLSTTAGDPHPVIPSTTRQAATQLRITADVDTSALVSLCLPSVVAYQDACWSALGDRTRRTIFSQIARRPCAVGELARDLPISRPAVSQHLKVLKDAGLVTDERDGNRRIYHVNPDGLAALKADLDQFWSGALAGFRDVVEQKEKQ